MKTAFLSRLGARVSLDGVIVAFAALVCMLFVVGLSDVRLTLLPELVPAPSLPLDIGERDAALDALVVDEADHPIEAASVRVFWMRDETAYFAGEHATDVTGHAKLEELPHGEVWILAYGKERARASLRAVLIAGVREEKLVLHPAKALDVLVVDELEKPVKGARVEVRGPDPLPYVAVTDAAGAARLDRLGVPPYAVRASAPTYEDAVRVAVVPSGSPLRLRLERLGGLVVTVLDESGELAANATVLAAGAALWPARSTETNAEGIAKIAGLRAGAYDLEARLGDLVSKTEVGIFLKPGETRPVELRLAKGKRVSVQVVDGDDGGAREKPIRDASVVLVQEGVSSFPLLGRTNAEGVVVLGPIPIESSAASARAKGFVPTSAVKVGERETEVVVPLHHGGAIVGDVVDDRGYPIAGATIEVVGSDITGMPIDETSSANEFRDDAFELALPGPQPLIAIGELGVMPGPIPDLPHGAMPPVSGASANGSGEAWATRKDGHFRADPVPPGRVMVIARHPQHVEATSETVTVTPGGEAHVHIVMREGGFIEGRVVEDDRTPVAGARIVLSATSSAIERFAIAADDGTFTFLAAPDEVLLSVSRSETPSDVAAKVMVVVPDRDRARVEIVLPKLRGEMRLRVRDNRRFPVDRVEVRAMSLDVEVPLRKTLFTDRDGYATLPDSVGLPLRITLVRPGKAPKVEQVDEAPRELELTLEEGVHGHGEVTGRGGRERLEGAEVTLFTAWGTRHVKTDRDGGFDIDDLAPGRLRMTATHEDYAEGRAIVVVEGDRDHPADLGAIDLAEAGEVEGEVVDDRGDPVRGARVGLDPVPTWLPQGPLPRGLTVTDKSGRFLLAGVPDGTVALEAFSAEYGRATVNDVEVRGGRTTRRVKIALPGDAPAREPKGAGGLAIGLGEREGHKKTQVEVVSVAPNSEAEAAGIEPGDLVLSVNGHDVHSMDVARRRMTGPLLEDVVLRLEREDGPPGGGTGPWLVRVRRERIHR